MEHRKATDNIARSIASNLSDASATRRQNHASATADGLARIIGSGFDRRGFIRIATAGSGQTPRRATPEESAAFTGRPDVYLPKR